jgi:hypothetical protein
MNFYDRSRTSINFHLVHKAPVVIGIENVENIENTIKSLFVISHENKIESIEENSC